MQKIYNYLSPLRIDHWVKNLVIIFGFIFAFFFKKFNIFDIKILFLGFFILCISASSNYLINEYCDREFDKNHPVKKWRYFIKNKESPLYVSFKYLLLILILISLSLLINNTFLYLNLFFLFCGIIYNLKPFRLKDILIIDVILEALNNPLRFLMGWFLVFPKAYPPISIILFFWLVGCFLMTMKRYSEYKFILEKGTSPIKYRLSFKKYNLDNLYNLSLFYCLFSFFFFTIFFIKYKIEQYLKTCCMLFIYIYLEFQKKNSQ